MNEIGLMKEGGNLKPERLFFVDIPLGMMR
jgi:hypothetical protein